MNNTSIIYLALFFVILAFIFMQQTKRAEDDEDFYIGSSYIRNAAPYYTTAFQAYPGKYMSYGSNRNSYCLQQHQEYAGYRNCMLYLE
uniref:Transmembrane protein n=1 Tax=Marseillevirus LCMAC202 TaxID=2506606 RepID=A0A481YXV7_9VIRU|nr:MAG: hypothetical protein LCMAC202_03200 [Marseillevirus LCMAC202]